jgi:uncharacterized protein YcbK (DUF882 family)
MSRLGVDLTSAARRERVACRIVVAKRRLSRLRRAVVKWGTFGVAVLVSAGFVGWYQPSTPLLRAEPVAEATIPAVGPALHALGRSGAVRIRFALPGAAVDYPLEVLGDPTKLRYEWVRVADSSRIDSTRALTGSSLTAPVEPGFYQLSLVRGGVTRLVQGLSVAVLVPFEQKRGPVLDGYRIGTFRAERRNIGGERPAGFVRVTEGDASLPISAHLRVADFITRDEQTQWPRYAAINPRLLDKVELVMEKISGWRDSDPLYNVHSGFRTPLYNRSVPRAAGDSRHQYGDAIDVAIDADGDGRLTARDTKLVALAVELVESEHPDLAGGMGVYTSRRYAEPYVHIDARGRKARWRG